MKILFLDIDGVLNSAQSNEMYYRQFLEAPEPKRRSLLRREEFCPIACSNLRRVLREVPDLKIIISSSWRIGRTLAELRTVLEKIGVESDRILDVTPRIHNEDRGIEIQEWLSRTDSNSLLMPVVEQFVIVDDDSDMAHLKPHLVQTDWRLGLTWIDAENIIKIFNGEVIEPENI